jgi:hypothetical protein
MYEDARFKMPGEIGKTLESFESLPEPRHSDGE